MTITRLDDRMHVPRCWHDVGGGVWWELTWRDAQGKERVVEASSIPLLMERATTMEREARRWDQP